MLLLTACLVLTSQKHVILDAVGDVMLGRYVGKRVAREGMESASVGVHGELSRADLVLGNLECAVTHAPFTKSKRFLLRAEPSSIDALQRFGFGAMSLANNHSRDCGLIGIRDTQKALRSVGVEPVGPGLEPVFLQRNGLKIGILGILDLPSHWESDASLDLTLKDLRSKEDVVVVMVHWGLEGSHDALSSQTALAKKLARLGVDLVLGSHPHVLQPVSWLSGFGDRRCLVAYSLGNFVFDAPRGDQRQSMILSVDFGLNGIQRFKEIPVEIDHGFPILR